MSPINHLASPEFIGLPPKFKKFRPTQERAVFDVLESKKRGRILNKPTGSGKSAVPMALMLILQERGLVLTGTKALADQYTDEFKSSGLTDIRGAGNYPCPALDGGELSWLGNRKGARADHCAHRLGFKCSLRNEGCPHYDAVRAARLASADVSNYSYWISLGKQRHYKEAGEQEESLGDFQWLFMDELHSVADELSRQLTIEVSPRSVEQLIGTMPPDTLNVDKWIEWAKAARSRSTSRLDELKLWSKGREANEKREFFSELREVQALERSLNELEHMRGDWIGDELFIKGKGKLYKFDPIWPAPYAESLLFRGIPNLVGMSATVNRREMKYLGLNDEDFDYYEYPSTFPLANRPVYFYPKVRLHYGSTEQDYRIWAGVIDNILRTRDDRKVIIHTVSYKLAMKLIQLSRHSARMTTHDPQHTRTTDAVRAFKESKREDLVLVSPSIGTGYDFPRNAAEVCIIAKTPWPYMGSKINQARKKQDPDYLNVQAAKQIQQDAGRHVRDEGDRGECVAPDTLVLTDDLLWVPAGCIQEGERLLTFEEEGEFVGGRVRPRKWKWGHVVKSLIRRMHRVRIITESSELICTPNHPWLVKNNKRGHEWRRSDALTKGDPLVKLLDVWDQEEEFDLGWLSGFYDGEGCLVTRTGRRNPTVSKIMLGQNEGVALDRCLELLQKFEFDFHQFAVRDSRSESRHYSIRHKGGFNELLRFLGQVRPARLLDHFVQTKRQERIRGSGLDRVICVEKLPDGPISSLQTSTGTYVAEGYGAHNTFIIDSSCGGLLKRRDLFAGYFLQAVRYIDQIPPKPPKVRPL